MNFVLQKLVFIALFSFIVKEVNALPEPFEFWSKIVDSTGDLYTKVVDSTSDLYTKAKTSIENWFSEVNCFGIHHKLFKVLKLNDTKARDVKFYFASQTQPNYTTVTILNNTFSLNNVDFNPYRDTMLISHGFLSSGKEPWLRDMKDAFLKYDDVNMIVVDWEEGSNTWNYVGAAVSTQVVGDEIAKLFDHIINEMVRRNEKRQLFGRIHFIGHSLGAHIVARAANLILERQKRKPKEHRWIVSRITGLDPAQPCFVQAGKDQRLDESDADFVDVIHTNAKNPLFMGLGLPEQIGYIDFYPNGGRIQPGCKNIDTSFWSRLRLPKEQVNAAICSHGRSHQFLIESIIEAIPNNCTFVSHPWSEQYNNTDELLLKTCKDGDCPEMGINSFNTFPRKKGIFFTPTGQEAPYCVVRETDRELIKAQLRSDVSMLDKVMSFVSG